MADQVVVLGTGGTIAGQAASASDHTGYTAAQLGVDTLLASVPGLFSVLGSVQLRSEQIAQLDSKDMDFDTMLRLARRCAVLLAQDEIRAVVITHGTDTLEETAYFLHCVIPLALQSKPIVLTCAMRPASSSQADGPGNLRDAISVALDRQAQGVLVVCAGDVHHAVAVQKVHTFALNAFSSGDPAQGEYGLFGQVVGDRLLVRGMDLIADADQAQSSHWVQSAAQVCWPRVEIVLNHAHAHGAIVRALLAASAPDDPLRGIVVAGTGNGTLSQALAEAISQARAQGVQVRISSRCAWGGIHAASKLSAVKERVRLTLSLACNLPH